MNAMEVDRMTDGTPDDVCLVCRRRKRMLGVLVCSFCSAEAVRACHIPSWPLPLLKFSTKSPE